MARTFKRISSDGGNFIKPRKENFPVEGFYRGERSNKFGISYIFEKETGEEVSIHGYADLKRKMQQVSTGDFVRIEYEGKFKSENAKYPRHDFVVSVAEQNEPQTPITLLNGVR